MCSLPGFYAPKADLTAPKSDFRFTPESGLKSDIAPCPKSAMCGRLRVGKDFLHVLQHTTDVAFSFDHLVSQRQQRSRSC